MDVIAKNSETGRLLRAYHEGGDRTARESLVRLHMPLVEQLAQHYSQGGPQLDDLVQAGSIGLLNAVDRFDPERGGDLTAYAIPNIKGEIRRYLRDSGSLVRVPRRLQEVNARARKVQGELGMRLGHTPTSSELARELDLDESTLATALDSEGLRNPLSLSSSDAGGDDGLDASERRLLLAGAFRALDEGERQIVYMRFIDGAESHEIANKLSISSRQLSRRLNQALAKMRAALEDGHEHRDADASDSVGKLLELPYHVTLVREEDAEADEGWRAQVEELPGCEARGRTFEEAAQAIHVTMPNWIAAAIARGESIPQPKRGSDFSGRLLLRMPQTLHAELARRASRDEASLNGYITGLLASAVSWQKQPHELARAEIGLLEPSDRRPLVSSTILVVLLSIAALAAIALLILALQQAT
jgi:RNA polymerase sigma-B factor